MISPEISSSSSVNPVRVFRQFSTTDGYNSCREALEQLQHGLDVTRRRHLQERLEAGLKQAQNSSEMTELSQTESDLVNSGHTESSESAY